MFLLAESPLPDPHSPVAVGWTLIVITWLLSTATSLVVGFFTIRNLTRKQTREVTVTGENVSKTAFEQHVEHNQKEHENLFSKLGGVDRGIRAEVKKDTEAIHEKINAVAREVSGLTTATDMQNQQLIRIEGKLDTTIRDQRPR